jgi:Tol biopolymer transport system component
MNRKGRVRTSRVSLLLAVLLVLAASLELAPRGWALAAETKRISVNSSEAQANGASSSPSTSAGGRFVVFYSDATNLVGGDTNGHQDVFVRDRFGTTRRVSVSSAGVQANGDSYDPVISADGRFVAFHSAASNLVGGDTNGVVDIFVRDRSTGRTSRVSVSSAGEEANGESDTSSISADGRFVAFLSHATNLVGGDTNGDADIFVRDRSTGRTRRVSVSSDEAQGNGPSADPVLSADGRIVAFSSQASNLVGGDSNSATDVFVRVRKAGTTTRVSVSSGAAEGNASSTGPDLSAGGRFVVFASSATNLVGNDTNGYADVFLHDRKNDTTRRVSITSWGAEGNALSNSPSISANGLVVAFRSPASNLVGDDANAAEDVFVRDRAAGTTRRMSVNSAGDQGNGRSYAPSISANGRYIAFNSAATNLVGKDTNAIDDIFIRGPLR